MTSHSTLRDPFGKQTDKASDTKQIVPQAEVWEIWNLEDRKVYWYVENFEQIPRQQG